jgi:hypothetical protein
MSQTLALRIVFVFLLVVLIGSCAGRRARTMPACSVPAVGACKACRIACPADQTPKCVAGQGNAEKCDVPASCSCS